MLQLVPHQELAYLIDGTATETSWHTITARLNIGMVLANAHFNESSVMMEALEAIVSVRDRYIRVGKYGATKDEAQKIGAGLVLTDEIQLACTRRQFRDAIEYVYRKVT